MAARASQSEMNEQENYRDRSPRGVDRRHRSPSPTYSMDGINFAATDSDSDPENIISGRHDDRFHYRRGRSLFENILDEPLTSDDEAPAEAGVQPAANAENDQPEAGIQENDNYENPSPSVSLGSSVGGLLSDDDPDVVEQNFFQLRQRYNLIEREVNLLLDQAAILRAQNPQGFESEDSGYRSN